MGVQPLNGFFNWLVEAGYLAGNPLALAKRPRAKRKPRVTRFLPHEHWGAVKDAIRAMDASTPALEAMAARARWIFSLLYLGGLRTSEICDGSMGDFLWRRSPDGTVRWWLEVTGKGQQTRLVPATTELMDEAKRYRLSLCLKPLPGEHEDFPLVAPLRGDKRLHISRSSLHAIVKDVMKAAAALVRQQGPEFEEAAQHIEQASTHWMRHTAASHQTDKADVKYVRDNLGHASIATTNIYTHTEDDMRHDVMTATHKIGW